jgi:hypothetical protein
VPTEQKVLVLRQTILAVANFNIEREATIDGEKFSLHFDQFNGAGAERFTVTFDHNGWENFKAEVQAAGTGIEVARVIPIDGNGGAA